MYIVVCTFIHDSRISSSPVIAVANSFGEFRGAFRIHCDGEGLRHATHCMVVKRAERSYRNGSHHRFCSGVHSGEGCNVAITIILDANRGDIDNLFIHHCHVGERLSQSCRQGELDSCRNTTSANSLVVNGIHHNLGIDDVNGNGCSAHISAYYRLIRHVCGHIRCRYVVRRTVLQRFHMSRRQRLAIGIHIIDGQIITVDIPLSIICKVMFSRIGNGCPAVTLQVSILIPTSEGVAIAFHIIRCRQSRLLLIPVSADRCVTIHELALVEHECHVKGVRLENSIHIHIRVGHDKFVIGNWHIIAVEVENMPLCEMITLCRCSRHSDGSARSVVVWRVPDRAVYGIPT